MVLPDHREAQEAEDPLEEDVVEPQAGGVADRLLADEGQDDGVLLPSALIVVRSRVRLQRGLVGWQLLWDEELLAVEHLGPSQQFAMLVDEGELDASGLDLGRILHLVLEDALEMKTS